MLCVEAVSFCPSPRFLLVTRTFFSFFRLLVVGHHLLRARINSEGEEVLEGTPYGIGVVALRPSPAGVLLYNDVHAVSCH